MPTRALDSGGTDRKNEAFKGKLKADHQYFQNC